jgi:hypothetical protein
LSIYPEEHSESGVFSAKMAMQRAGVLYGVASVHAAHNPSFEARICAEGKALHADTPK